MSDRTIEQLKAEGVLKETLDGTVEVDATNLTGAELDLVLDLFFKSDEPTDG